MPTFAEVVRAALPEAQAVGAPEVAHAAADVPVSWVRVMRARVPAFDALEAGDIVIVPKGVLEAVVHEPADAAHVAEELARAAVAGVVLLTPADALADRLIAAGVPVVRAAGDDDVAVERAVMAHLAGERAVQEREVARLEATVQAVALRAGGAQEMAAAVAGFARRAVAIEDADGVVVALHAPADLPASGLLAARYERRRGSIALRTELPGGGALVLLGDERPGEVERTAVARVAVLVALELARYAMPRRSGERGETLPAAGPPWVVLMARQVLPGQEATLAEREQRRQQVARLAPARRLLLRGDAASIELRAVAATTPEDPLALDLAGRIGRLLARPVAVSQPFRDRLARPAADAEARALLEAADELAAAGQPPRVMRGDRLAMYRLLGNVHNLPDGERHARALLGPLLFGSPADQDGRLATLRAVLDGAGPAEAAGILGVHRNTVAYRVRAILARTGWDLDDPDLRFALWLALRIVRPAQEKG